MTPAATILIETRAFANMLERLAEATGKQLGHVVRQNARLMAWNLAHDAQPYGMGVKEKKLGQAAVMRDVGRVFRSASSVYKELRDTEEKKVARAFWASVRNGNYRLAEDFLRRTKLRDRNAPIGRLEPTFHRRARNNRGRVQRLRVAQIIPDAKQIREYAKIPAARVGFGKAGFITAGLQVGPVRGVPAWVKRHVGKAPGQARDRSKGLDPHVDLQNLVRYASEILPDHMIARALRKQRKKMESHIRYVLAAEAKKVGMPAEGLHGARI